LWRPVYLLAHRFRGASFAADEGAALIAAIVIATIQAEQEIILTLPI